MADKTVLLHYTIWLTDQAEVLAKRATDAPVRKAPTAAALLYNAPIKPGTAATPEQCITSEWFSNNTQNFPRDQASFERCTGGWFGVCWLFGEKTNYIWVGDIAYTPKLSGGESPIPDEPPVPMAQRHWIDGFEMPVGGELSAGGTLGGGGASFARAASRHIDGYGMLVDGPSVFSRTHTLTENGAAAGKAQWERFYVRPRKYDPLEVNIWKVATTTFGSFELNVLPGSTILWQRGSGFNQIAGTGPALALHTWTRIDILYRFGPIAGPAAPLFRFYLNGVLTLEGTASTNDCGLGGNYNIGTSSLGNLTGTGTLVADFDDWIGADWPTAGTQALVFPGLDWQNGSRVAPIFASRGEMTLEGTLAAGSPIVTALASTAGLEVGMEVHGVAGVGGVGPDGAAPEQTAAYVAAIKAECIAAGLSLVGADGAFEITSRVAWGLASEGAGLLAKPSGNNSHGYAVDIVMFPDGSGVNILSDAGGTNGPLWDTSVVISDGLSRYRPAVTPTGAGGSGVVALILSIDGQTQVTLDTNADADGVRLLAFNAVTGFGGDHDPLWLGDWRLALQRPVDDRAIGSGLTSATASALLSMRTDAARSVDAIPNALGVAALRVGVHGRWPGLGVSAEVGYRLPGGADVMTQVTGTNLLWEWRAAMYRPSGLVDPLTPLAGLRLKFKKNAVADAAAVRCLMAAAELIGVFGPEDINPSLTGAAKPATLRPMIGIHNAPYPFSVWARSGPAPPSPVGTSARLYTGNGTATELVYRWPVHFLWIRPVLGSNRPAVWISSATGPHAEAGTGFDARVPAQVLIDPAFVGADLEDAPETQVLVRIPGADAKSNQNAIGYVVIALADPGMRFLSAGALLNHTGAADLITPLDNPAFTPEAVLLLTEYVSGSSANGALFKGIGHAAAAISPLTAAEVANGLAMSNGTLTYKAGLTIQSMAQYAYLAFRRNDGSDAPLSGKARVVQLATYTGDGSATRTVALAPASGRRPMFAIVTPHNGASFERDPGHTTTTSTFLNDGTINAATGIKAGAIDEITVGVLLNAAGIVYDVLVIPGTVEACEGGWSCPGDFDPVPPDAPPDGGPWDPAPDEPEPPTEPVEPPGETPPGGPTSATGPDFGVECMVASTGIVNEALSRLGISKQVGNVSVQKTGAIAADIPGVVGIVQGTADLAIGMVVTGGGFPLDTLVQSIDSLSQLTTSASPLGPFGPVTITFSGAAGIRTEASQEATTALLHYRTVVTAVLRDFPWPFATRYATLALVGTSPANADWLYRYRRPIDCVFERRLVVLRAGAVDPTPPPFQLSSDAGGGLIFSNQPLAVLEYTARPGCSASVGDPLFREALIWKLSGAMAPALSRMTDIVKHCEEQYQQALVKATMVIRPGTPGEVPDVGILDVALPHLRANTAVVNRGLVRIGARTIANLDREQSRCATAAREIFEAELRSCLRDHPWAFATAYVTPAAVAGTATVAANDDWQYSYRLTDDVVFVRRIITDAGKRGFQRDPPPFKLARDANGPLLLTDHPAPHLEVTVRMPGAVAGADDLFREVFAWRLAASLAPSVALTDPERVDQEGRGPDFTQKDPPRVTQRQRAETARWAWAMYGQALNRAQLADVREQQQELDDHLPDWLTGRD